MFTFDKIPKKKCEPISLGGAALLGGISAAGNVISSIFGSSAQNSANEANIQINRENRDWQSKENQLQRNFQLDMWNKTNEYNTPQAMMERYKKAGLNPYIISGESGQGSATMPSSPSMQGAPTSPTIMPSNPLSGLGSGLNAGVNTLLQSVSVQSNLQAQKADAYLKIMDAAQQAYKMGGRQGFENFMSMAMPAFKGFDVDSSLISRQMNAAILKDEKQAAVYDITEKLQSQYGAKVLQSKLDAIDQSISESVARIGKMASDAKVNDANIKLIAEQVLTEVAKQFNLRAQGAYYYANAETINAIRQYVVDIYHNQAQQIDLETSEMRADWVGNTGVRMFKQSPQYISNKGASMMSKMAGERKVADLESNELYIAVDKVTDQISKFLKVGVNYSNSKGDFNTNSNSTNTNIPYQSSPTPPIGFTYK